MNEVRTVFVLFSFVIPWDITACTPALSPGLLVHHSNFALIRSLFPFGRLVVELPEGDRVVRALLAPPPGRNCVVVVPLVQFTRELCGRENKDNFLNPILCPRTITQTNPDLGNVLTPAAV